MASTASPATPHVYMDAVLEPSRSLSRKGYVQFMLVTVAGAVVLGVFFLRFGFVPILAFLGLDVLVLWLAFRTTFRHQRQRTRVRVTADAIDVFHIDGRGRERTISLPSAFTRACNEAPNRSQGFIRISSSGKSYAIGRFLNEEERGSFVVALKDALANARRERHVST